MPSYLIIVNPTSGRGNGQKMYPIIEQRLKELGLEGSSNAFEMRWTENPGHASQLSEEAAAQGYDVVVAVGGDGTANEVVNGLMHARSRGYTTTALGVIPVGRGNDFSYGIRIPHDVEQACQLLVKGNREWIDVGFVQGGDYPEGRYFGNGVGIGFDAVVGFEALKLKWLSGFPSYLVAAIKTILLYYQAPELEIHMDDQVFVQPALMVSIMNGQRLGGGFMMAPDGKINDGRFDLCIAGQISRLEILRVIPLFLKGSQAKHPAIRMGRASRLVIRSHNSGIPAHADGETLCTTGQTLELSIIPQALEVIMPPERSS